MPESDPGSYLDQLGVFCGGERALFDAEPVSRAPDERRVADRLGPRQEPEAPRWLRQLADPLEIVILEVAREVRHSEELEAARQLRCADAARQIEQSERVAARLGDDAVADAIVEPTRHGSDEQRACVVLTE